MYRSLLICTKKANRNSILPTKNRDAISTLIGQTYSNRLFKCTTKLNLNRRHDLPLGNLVVDAADLRADACLAKYSGVAAARHFALGFFLLVQTAPPAPHL